MLWLVLLATAIATRATAQSASPSTISSVDSNPLTKEQGDEILNELRLIRRLIQEQLSASRSKDTQPQRASVTISPKWHAMGKDDAPVTMVEFLDYECPFCRNFGHATLPLLKKAYVDTGKVRFISVDDPLDIHPDARGAALAASCAGDQGVFWEYRGELLREGARLDQSNLVNTAAEAGLNMAAYKECLSNAAVSVELDSTLDVARALGVQGTPSFVIGTSNHGLVEGKRISGALQYEVFDAAIKAALAQVPLTKTF